MVSGDEELAKHVFTEHVNSKTYFNTNWISYECPCSEFHVMGGATTLIFHLFIYLEERDTNKR